MRDKDLSNDEKIFPTIFEGARFVPYPPYMLTSQQSVNRQKLSAKAHTRTIIYTEYTKVTPAGGCVSAPPGMKTTASMLPVQAHDQRLSEASKMLDSTLRKQFKF
jgi:hypothetical protein